MRSTTLLIIGSFLFGRTVGVQAQDVPPKPPLFGSLFAQPTGLNGYEDWVQAGDLIRNNSLLNEAMEPGATLTLKRRVLADTSVQQALHLLREGLEKSILSPHPAPDENTVFPELAAFRALGRLLCLQLYVQFADGRVDAAIDTLAEGLRFAYRSHTNTLISRLAANAINAIVIKEFALHLDQLSEYQCNRVRHIIEECLEWPSSILRAFEDDKQQFVRILDRKRNDPGNLKRILSVNDDNFDENTDPAEKERVQKLMAYLDSQPTDLGLVIDHTEAMIQNQFDMLLLNMKLPVQERKPLLFPDDKSLSSTLFSLLMPNVNNILDRAGQSDALLRLLGTHAAIRSYRWEHNSLPDTLTLLRLGSLGIDPFTGATLDYKRQGKSYELRSQGPPMRDDKEVPIANKYKSIQLTLAP